MKILRIITSASKDAMQLEFLLTDGNANFGSLIVSYKVKSHLPCDSAIPLLDIYPKDVKTCSHRNLNVHVYKSFLHNHQKLETKEHKYLLTDDYIASHITFK